MKTMKQLQDEVISQARFDGGWPRVVMHITGAVQLCHDQAAYDRARRSVSFEMGLAVGGVVGILMDVVMRWLIL
jgi:hypothetical protein